MSRWSDPLRRRWIGWALLSVGFLLVNFHRNSSAVLSEQLALTFETTGAELGLLHSSFFYVYAVLQVPAGVLIDRLGTRTISAGGMLVMSAGVLGFAVADGYWVAFAGRLLAGVGASVIYLSTLRFAANWYRADEFATITGVTGTFAGLGGLLATTPLAIAIAAYGWRPSIQALGAFGILLAAAIYFTAHTTPGRAGLSPVEGVPATAKVSLSELWTMLRRILGEAETWLLGTFLFFTIGINFTVFGLWGIPYLVHLYGLSVQEASTYLLVATGAGLLSGPLMGLLSDRLGRRTELVIVGATVFTGCYGAIAVLGAPPLVFIAVLLVAIRLVGGVIILVYTVMKERYPETSSTAIGIVNSIGFFGGATFPALMGAALDAFWTGQTVGGARVYTATGYRIAFGIATLSGVIGLACVGYFFYRERREAPAESGTPA